MVRHLILVLLLVPVLGGAQERRNPEPAAGDCSAKARFLPAGPSVEPGSADPGFDALHYHLRLTLVPSASRLRGHVTMTARVLEDSLTGLTLDLAAPMTVDSVRVNGLPTGFTRPGDALAVSLPGSVPRGGIVGVDIFYHGVPSPTGFGSFVFSSGGSTPWVWSLSQPYGARDWWPCKDHPSDKPDSVAVSVTAPAGLEVASNGLLRARRDNGDGTWTHEWVERYPIATYLVSIAVADYAEFSDWFPRGPADSMQILNYVLPQDLERARPALGRTVPMLHAFTHLFGEYPFLAEKYGHAQFGRGGAMEHQTMTSTTGFDENTVAHELAHQWFGDLITCASWGELWLNEGFATYGEALFKEAAYGAEFYRAHMRLRMDAALSAPGTLYVRDTSIVGELFRYSRVYAKGASVLHMLRRVLGDSVFFDCLRGYVRDPRLRFGTATTADFRMVCEGVARRPLAWFFDQWVFGEGYPIYSAELEAEPEGGGYRSTVTVRQRGSGASPQFFTMPVELRLVGEGRDTTVIVEHRLDGEQFAFHLPWQPRSVTLDPDGWILKEVSDPGGLLPDAVELEPNFPNPFNAGTVIRYGLPGARTVSLAVFDGLGRRVRVLEEGQKPAGRHTSTWDGLREGGETAASGVYHLRLVAGSEVLTRAMVVVR